MALQVLDRCLEKGPEDANPDTSKVFYIEYNYELLDDAFSVWDKPTGLENEYYQGKGLVRKCWRGRLVYLLKLSKHFAGSQSL